MKILIGDMDFLKTHLFFNYKIINILASEHDVVLASPKGFYDPLQLSSNIQIVDIKFDYNQTRGIRRRLEYFSLPNQYTNLCKNLQPDAVIFLTFNTNYFILFRTVVKACPKCYLYHHNNVDKIRNSKYSRFLFNTYKNNVYHLVLEDFIRTTVVQSLHVDSDRVIVVPHPLQIMNVDQHLDKEYKCCCISNSTNGDFIQDLIQGERNTHILSTLKFRVIVKSKDYIFDDGYLTVKDFGHIPDELFQKYFMSSEIILAPFPNNFGNRVSGTLIEALSNNKIVIGTPFDLMLDYQKKYPNVCYMVKDGKEFLRVIKDINHYEDAQQDFEKFSVEHSDTKVRSSINLALEL